MSSLDNASNNSGDYLTMKPIKKKSSSNGEPKKPTTKLNGNIENGVHSEEPSDK